MRDLTAPLRYLALATAMACLPACLSGRAAQPRPASAIPLEVPEPPPRAALPPVLLPDPPEREPPAREAQAPPTSSGGRPSRPAQAQPAPPPAPPVTAPAAAPPLQTPATDLKPGGVAAKTLSTSEVRQIVARTSQKLDALDRRRLSAGQQADFDTARRFLAQAEQAIRANNELLAQYAAEKAETLANGLR